MRSCCSQPNHLTIWTLLFSDHVRLGEYDSRFEMDCDRSDPEDIFCSPPVQDVKFEKFAAHPAYSLTTFINDIGIIKLSEVASVKQQNIRPICLPLSKDLIEIPKQLVISGWGRTQNASSSPILQKAYVPLYNKDDCLRKFKYSKRVRTDFILTDGQFCAGGQGMQLTCLPTCILVEIFSSLKTKLTLAKVTQAHQFRALRL